MVRLDMAARAMLPAEATVLVAGDWVQPSGLVSTGLAKAPLPATAGEPADIEVDSANAAECARSLRHVLSRTPVQGHRGSPQVRSRHRPSAQIVGTASSGYAPPPEPWHDQRFSAGPWPCAMTARLAVTDRTSARIAAGVRSDATKFGLYDELKALQSGEFSWFSAFFIVSLFAFVVFNPPIARSESVAAALAAANAAMGSILAAFGRRGRQGLRRLELLWRNVGRSRRTAGAAVHGI